MSSTDGPTPRLASRMRRPATGLIRSRPESRSTFANLASTFSADPNLLLLHVAVIGKAGRYRPTTRAALPEVKMKRRKKLFRREVRSKHVRREDRVLVVSATPRRRHFRDRR